MLLSLHIYAKQSSMKGLFIVLYGINNLGKSTQAKKLVERMNSEGHPAQYLKYPIYNLHPSGTILNQYLREGNPFDLSAREGQTAFALNRTQFEPELKKLLEQGIHVIAEDYTGTGMAWGIGTGVSKEYLETINAHLLKEDLSFLFDGERFVEATEKGHKHETDDKLMTVVRAAHQTLGQAHGWTPIAANQSIEKIHEELWNHILPSL